jgi:hypothetical protein
MQIAFTHGRHNRVSFAAPLCTLHELAIVPRARRFDLSVRSGTEAGAARLRAMSFAGWMHREFGVEVKPLRGGVRDIPGRFVRPIAQLQWENREPARHHGLPAPLIVSLTSYAPRFRSLALTLQCLISQSVRPDGLLLWLADEDFDVLPAEVRALKLEGLEILRAVDTRSYKKIVPALAAHPEAFIATADDDVYYWPTWLEDLVSRYEPGSCDVLALRAHRIRLDAKGRPAPYINWRFNVREDEASPLIFPTGVGGVLYPPGSLHEDTTDVDKFMRLCPSNDDLWMFWMSRLAGAQSRKVGPRRAFVPWPRSQRVGLQHENLSPGAGFDAQIANMIAHYGWPLNPR